MIERIVLEAEYSIDSRLSTVEALLTLLREAPVINLLEPFVSAFS